MALAKSSHATRRSAPSTLGIVRRCSRRTISQMHPQPAAIAVIRAYLDNTLTQAAAMDRLRDEALTLDPESFLAFAERRRTKVLAYPEGREAIWRTTGRTDLKGIRALFVEHPFAVK